MNKAPGVDVLSLNESQRQTMEFDNSAAGAEGNNQYLKQHGESVTTETPIFLTPGYMADNMSQQSKVKPERRFTYRGQDISELSDSVLETMNMDNLLTAVEELRQDSQQYQGFGARRENENLGYLYYFLFTVCSALGSAFGKGIYTLQEKKYPDEETVTGMQLLVLRSVWALLVIVIFANKNMLNIMFKWIPRSSVPTLAFRCGQGTLTDTINYLCATKLPLGIVGVVNNLAPIVTVILARLFLKESIGWIDVIFLMLSFVGCATIVLGASSDSSDYPTIVQAPGMYGALFMCPILSGGGTIALRKMRKLNTQSVVFWCNFTTFWFNLICILVLNLMHNQKKGEPKMPWHSFALMGAASWTLSVTSGLLSLLNFVFKFMAMQNCSAAKLQKMTPIISLYSFVIDISVFHEDFTYIQLGGLIELTVLYVGVFAFTVYQSKEKKKEMYMRRATRYVKRVQEQRRLSRMNSVKKYPQNETQNVDSVPLFGNRNYKLNQTEQMLTASNENVHQ